LHLTLNKKLPGVKREHVFFHGGAYGLSFIDVSQIWQNEPFSRLSFIASNFAPLESLTEKDATKALLDEIMQYLPITADDIDGDPVINTNVTVPLFINTIGAWENRPVPRTRVPNLYIAGDYVQNAIDLACMEGAVSASLAAASALLSDLGDSDPPKVDVPSVWPRPLLLLARASLFPVVVVASVTARIASVLSPAATPETPVKKVMNRRRHRQHPEKSDRGKE